MHQTKLAPFVVSYQNSEEFHHLKKEIWTGHLYYTELDSVAPRIIDAGAHIGLASLYFAKNYPTAKILSLEPNPITFKVLEENIWQNRLEDRVETKQLALATQMGTSTLYHQPQHSDWQLNSNLNNKTWQNTPLTASTTVQTVTLSSLLDQPTDLLKLDIEGAELEVLKEAANQLRHINQIFVEFHPSAENNINQLLELLTKNNFTFSFWKKGKEIRFEQITGLVLIHAQQS